MLVHERGPKKRGAANSRCCHGARRIPHGALVGSSLENWMGRAVETFYSRLPGVVWGTHKLESHVVCTLGKRANLATVSANEHGSPSPSFQDIHPRYLALLQICSLWCTCARRGSGFGSDLVPAHPLLLHWQRLVPQPQLPRCRRAWACGSFLGAPQKVPNSLEIGMLA